MQPRAELKLCIPLRYPLPLIMLVCLTSLMMRLSHRQSRLQFQTRLHSGHADGIFSSFPHPACVFPYLLASYLNFDPGLLCLLQVNLRLKLDLPGARPALDACSRPLQVRANNLKRLPAPALPPPMLLAQVAIYAGSEALDH